MDLGQPLNWQSICVHVYALLDYPKAAEFSPEIASVAYVFLSSPGRGHCGHGAFLGDSLSCRNFPLTLTTSTLAAQTSKAVSDWASATPEIFTKMELSQDFPSK